MIKQGKRKKNEDKKTKPKENGEKTNKTKQKIKWKEI